MHIPHLIRTYRQRMGLHPHQLSSLVGTSASMVSKHERFLLLPKLETAFSYAICFGIPVSELFAGLFHQVRQQTLSRARTFCNSSLPSTPSPTTEHAQKCVHAMVEDNLEIPFRP